MIIFIPDADILRNSAYFGFGASKVLGMVINYLVKQVMKILDMRKEDSRAVR